MEIVFWENDNGKKPVADFIESLELKHKINFYFRHYWEKHGTKVRTIIFKIEGISFV